MCVCASKALAKMRTLVDPPILVYKYWLHLYKYRNPRMGMEIKFRKYKMERIGWKKRS